MLTTAHTYRMSDFAALKQEIRQFADERDWAQFHDPKSLFIALTGEIGEVAELLQWLPADQARIRLHEPELHEPLQDELADVLIYLLRLADVTDVDLLSSARRKLAKNAEKYPVESSRGISDKR